jgi:26S proteasome regulatory subunit N9
MSLENLANEKLYHELTVALHQALKVTEKQRDRVALFRRFVIKEETFAAMNRLSVVDLMRELLRSGEDDAAVVLELLDEFFPKSEEDEATFQSLALRIECLLRSDVKSADARELLSVLEDLVEAGRVVEWRSLSEYYRVAVLISKRAGDLDRLYQAAIKYLGITPAHEVQVWILRDAVQAGLLGPGVFDVGALLAEERLIKEILSPEESAHVLDILKGFDQGAVGRLGHWNHLTNDQRKILKEKMQLMALLDMAAKHKLLSLADISKHCCPDGENAQLLVLKGFGAEILKGAIDQVARTVRVDWVRPRVLDKQRIAELKQRLELWKGQVDLVLGELQEY